MAELNGLPVESDVLLRLALTNYGHFTTMRVEDGRVRGLGLHLERLVRDCRAVFGAGLDTEAVRRYVRQAVAGESGPRIVRVTVLDPAVDLGRPAAADQPQVLVTVRPGAAVPQSPLRVKSVRHEREVPAVKHTGLFGALHARRACQLDGYDDALFVGADGRVSEGGTWNIGFIRRDGVVWPEAEALPGVTAALLRQREAGTGAPVTLDELPDMQAAFATNAAIGVRAVSHIDEVSLDTGHPLLARLREAYLAVPGERL